MWPIQGGTTEQCGGAAFAVRARSLLVRGRPYPYRHDLGRRIFHGKKGEITRNYYEGMEDQLSALGLVLNCVVRTVGTPSTWIGQ
ncbi:Tn3 family transposase [Nocardia sp. CWNU-33]|uniref:Tn3 family transposase n=1 Tax=Nocardia sp. CWNU-33 TaxID=3392117 RepID=UPI00398F0156